MNNRSRILRLMMVGLIINSQVATYAHAEGRLSRLGKSMRESFSRLWNRSEPPAQQQIADDVARPIFSKDNYKEDWISGLTGGLLRDFSGRVQRRLFLKTIGRSEEVDRLVTTLGEMSSNGAIIEGAEGVGKTHILVALAERIQANDVPQKLAGAQIVEVVPEHALMKDFQSFKDQVNKLAKEIRNQDLKKFNEAKKVDANIRESDIPKPMVIFHVPRLHNLIGGENSDKELIDVFVHAAQAELGESRCKFVIEGLSTQIDRMVPKSAYLGKLERIKIEDMSDAELYGLAKDMAKSLKSSDNVTFEDSVLQKAVELSQRYYGHFGGPSAIYRLLDGVSSLKRNLAKTKTSPFSVELNKDIAKLEYELAKTSGLKGKYALQRQSEIPKELAELRAKLRKADEKFDQVRRDAERLEKIFAEVNALKAKSGRQAAIPAHLAKEIVELETRIKTVHEEDLALQISRQTGTDLARIIRDPSKMMTDEQRLEKYLNRVYGQDHAVRWVIAAVKVLRGYITTNKGPAGSILFMGKPGTGKTELAKALADIDLDGNLLRIDLAEYTNEASVWKLTGAASGHVDADAGGVLTEGLRKTPNTVLLLDEIDRAHPKVTQALMGGLDPDNGRILDGKGRPAYFNRSIVIGTTNLLEDLKIPDGLSADEKQKFLREKLKETGRFDGAFLDRFTTIVMFNDLDDVIRAKIIFKIVQEINENLAKSIRKIELTDEAKAHLVEMIRNTSSSRGLKTRVVHAIQNPVNDIIISGRYTDNLGASQVMRFDEGDLLQVGYSPSQGLTFQVVR